LYNFWFFGVINNNYFFFLKISIIIFRSGKTTLLTEILLGEISIITVNFDRIVYCYGEYLNETFNILKQKGLNIKLVEGLPISDKIEPFNNKKIIV